MCDLPRLVEKIEKPSKCKRRLDFKIHDIITINLLKIKSLV